MTPKERADKIWNSTAARTGHYVELTKFQEEGVNWITVQIEEAVAEARKEFLSDEIKTGAQLMSEISEEMRKAK